MVALLVSCLGCQSPFQGKPLESFYIPPPSENTELFGRLKFEGHLPVEKKLLEKTVFESIRA